MSMKCSRCHREDVIEVEKIAEATALEEADVRKKATLAKINEFIASLPKEDLPEFFALVGDKTLAHSYLCDPSEDEGKRSCAKRVADLMSDVAERPERKPRAKKEKPEAAEPKA